jgi:hypothetical protein
MSRTMTACGATNGRGRAACPASAHSAPASPRKGSCQICRFQSAGRIGETTQPDRAASMPVRNAMAAPTATKSSQPTQLPSVRGGPCTSATYGVPSAPITCSTNCMISSGSSRSLRGRAVRATTVRAMPVSRTDGAQLARPRDSWLHCYCQCSRAMKQRPRNSRKLSISGSRKAANRPLGPPRMSAQSCGRGTLDTNRQPRRPTTCDRRPFRAHE